MLCFAPTAHSLQSWYKAELCKLCKECAVGAKQWNAPSYKAELCMQSKAILAKLTKLRFVPALHGAFLSNLRLRSKRWDAPSYKAPLCMQRMSHSFLQGFTDYRFVPALYAKQSIPCKVKLCMAHFKGASLRPPSGMRLERNATALQSGAFQAQAYKPEGVCVQSGAL